MSSEIVGEMRAGSGSIKRGDNYSLTYSSTYNFLVVTNDPFTSREEVLLSTPGLPVVGVVYGLINAICVSKDAKRNETNTLYWDVVCQFETGATKQQQDTQNNPDSDNPITWIPLFTIDTSEGRLKVLTECKDGSGNTVKCVNTAKTPFREPLTRPRTLCSFSFSQFEDPSTKINTILDRNNCVNDVTFKDFAARTLRCNVVSAELGYFGQYNAWKVHYKMTYDPDKWDDKRLSVGPTQLDGSICKDLKNVGQIMGNLDIAGVQTFSDPEEMVFRTHEEKTFSSFIRT